MVVCTTVVICFLVAQRYTFDTRWPYNGRSSYPRVVEGTNKDLLGDFKEEKP